MKEYRSGHDDQDATRGWFGFAFVELVEHGCIALALTKLSLTFLLWLRD